jgi:hypothetical protein
VDNVVLVAVVDAGEDLLDEDGGVSLCELASCDDLVEQLSALANVSDDVVALLILKELVHFEDIGMVQVLQVVYLVEKHLLLIVVHMRLPQHLHCSLCSTLPVNADSYLSKGPRPEHFPDSIVIS